MNRTAAAREIVAIMKTMMAGRSYSVRYIIRVNQVFSGSITTDAEWKSMYGRPTPQSIKRYVEKFNESLEPDGANSHIGRRGAIFGGVVIDQTTGDVVAEWTDRNIIRFYTSKPAFEVVSSDCGTNMVKNQKDGHEQGSTNWLLDEMRKGQIFELPIAKPYEYNAGDRTMNRQAVVSELVAVAKDLAAFDAGKLDMAKKVLRTVGKIPGAYLTTYKNGRENGFALSKGGKKVVFSENRNSDDIVVYSAEDSITGFDDNNIPSEETYRDKKLFRYDDFDGAAKFIRSFLR